MKDLLLEVKGLRKKYDNNIVLKEINLKIKEGIIYGLLGKNGAGKTTLIECVEGLRPFDKGEVLFNRSKENVDIAKFMGVQLQNEALPNMLKVEEALNLFSVTKNCKLSEKLIKKMGLEKLLDKQYYQLSTGQKRIVSLFLALNHNPKIVFLDEPTAGLDVEAKISVYKVIKEYKEKGTSFILTSHDMSEIERIADIVGVLMDGKIIFEGSPKKLTGNSNNLYKISYLLKRANDLEENNISDQTNINYKEIVTSNITLALEELITHNRSSNLEFSDLRIERPTLEEAFIKILENEKKENK